MEIVPSEGPPKVAPPTHSGRPQAGPRWGQCHAAHAWIQTTLRLWPLSPMPPPFPCFPSSPGHRARERRTRRVPPTCPLLQVPETRPHRCRRKAALGSEQPHMWAFQATSVTSGQGNDPQRRRRRCQFSLSWRRTLQNALPQGSWRRRKRYTWASQTPGCGCARVGRQAAGQVGWQEGCLRK